MICLILKQIHLISAIPALQPIVHDLFVLRGTNKADAGKELETQKEVVVSMLLRLIQYHQVGEEDEGFLFVVCERETLLWLLKVLQAILMIFCTKLE